MGETTLLNKLAMKRLYDRRYRDKNGQMLVLLPGDQEAVGLTPRAWERLCADYLADLAPARRLMRWSVLFTIPASIMMLSAIHASPLIMAIVNWIEGFRYGGYVTSMVVLAGPPLALLAVHWWLTDRAKQAMEIRLAKHVRVPLPDERRPILIQAYEIVAMVLVGPGIVIRAVGTVFPNIWRNTPFSGSHIGLFDAVAIGAVLVVTVHRWRHWRATRQAATSAARTES